MNPHQVQLESLILKGAGESDPLSGAQSAQQAGMSKGIIQKLRGKSRIGFIVFVFGCLVLIVSALVVVNARNLPTQGNQKVPLQSFHIRIRPWGIEPKQALLRHEEVNLILDDTTGATATIIFERNGSGKAAEIGHGQKRHEARKFKLPAGEYEFYVAGRPQERAKLTVLRPKQ